MAANQPNAATTFDQALSALSRPVPFTRTCFHKAGGGQCERIAP